MAREYDEALVRALREKAYTIDFGGVDVLVKPVPDDDRPHALDPRVLENALRSARAAAGSAAKPPAWTSLLGVRHRPLKADHELVRGEVAFDEFLIPAGNHKINVYTWEPAGRERPSATLIFIHGGGFTAGDVTQYRHALALIAELAGALVVFPEYRLAPEAPFPAPVEDCMACVAYVREHAGELGVDLERLVIGGDSAGGSLANACIQQVPAGTFAAAVELYPCVEAGEEDPLWSYDLYPWLPEQAEVARGRVDRLRGGMPVLDTMYTQGRESLDHPWVSAACAPREVLAAFPPTTVLTGEFDYLRYQDEKFVRLLRGAGVEARAIRYGGCDHGFFEWPGVRPQTEEACMVFADVLRATTEGIE